MSNIPRIKTQTKVQAQKVTESLATKSADDARNLFNITKAGKKLYICRQQRSRRGARGGKARLALQ